MFSTSYLLLIAAKDVKLIWVYW